MQILREMIGEFIAELLSQFEAIWPVESRRSPQDFAYLSHLVLLGLPREQRPHREEFCHDTAHCKDVDWSIVVGCTQQDFRGSIPARAHVVREWGPRINLLRQTKRRHIELDTTTSSRTYPKSAIFTV